jgi:hypothetical protein
MARIRTIKPEFFTHSKITRLTPLARLFYVSLWCEADRAGRMKWDAETLKDRYLPRDKCDVEEIGNALAKSKLIRFYEVAGQVYIDIPGFLEHQVINNRESESSLPAYSDDACLTRESGDTHAACGKEGRKGREGKEGTTPVAPKGATHSEGFLKFWEAFPNKVGKDAAWRAWKKRDDKPDLETILAAVQRYIATKPVDREWCNPVTWLNQGRWNDAPAVVRTALDEPATTASGRPESSWRSALKTYAAQKRWPPSFGPEPGMSGCECPRHLIEEICAQPRNLTMAG